MIEDPNVHHFKGTSGYMESAPVGRFYDAHKVRIAWNIDDDGRVSSVFLTDDFDEWLGQSERYRASGGDCYRDWMVPVDKRDGGGDGPDQLFDPAGTFGTLLSYGFATKAVMRQALLQFAQIDDCLWARRMLFAIDGELVEGDLAKPG